MRLRRAREVLKLILDFFFPTPMSQPHGYLVKAVIAQHTDIFLVCASIYAMCLVKQILLDELKGITVPVHVLRLSWT